MPGAMTGVSRHLVRLSALAVVAAGLVGVFDGRPAGATPIVCEVATPAAGAGIVARDSVPVSLPANTLFRFVLRGSTKDDVIGHVVFDPFDSAHPEEDWFWSLTGADAQRLANSPWRSVNYAISKPVVVVSNTSTPFDRTFPTSTSLTGGIQFYAEPQDCIDQGGRVTAIEPLIGTGPANAQAGDPVTPSIGNFVYQPVGLGSDVPWLPTYNSLDPWDVIDIGSSRLGPFGRNWASLLDVRFIRGQSTTPAVFRDASGRMASLPVVSTNNWAPVDWMQATSATRSSSGTYEIDFKSGDVWSFDIRGRLVSMTTPLGRTVSISRGSNGVPTRLEIENAGVDGFAWKVTDGDADGLIDAVTGPFSAGLSTPPSGSPQVDFGYDSSLRLETISAPHGSGTSASALEEYGYGDGGLIETVTRHKGGSLAPVTVIANTFDDLDRVDTQTTATGEVDEFTYAGSPSGMVTTVDHDNGSVSERVIYHHDLDGRLTSVIDPYEETSSSAWSGDSQTGAASRRGAEATATYDTAGRVTSVGLPDPDSAGEQAGTKSATYCAAGDRRLVDVTDAAGDVTRFWWTTGTDPYACDAGRVVPVKVTSHFGTSDATDLVITATDDMPTRMVADPGGEELVTDLVWDAGRQLLLSSTTYPDGPSSAGLRSFYGYDGAGRRTVVRDATGVETWTTYDAAGRTTGVIGPVAVTRSCSTTCSFGSTPPSGPTESWVYNLDGSLASHTDAESRTTTYSVAYPSGGGRVETVTPPGHGDDPGSSTSSAQGVTVSTFDAFDRLVSVERGDPAVAGSTATTTYAYDPLGRLVSTTREVGGTVEDLVESYGYDADGNRTVTAFGDDPDDLSTARWVRTYDLRGRLVHEQGPTGDTTAPTAITGSSPTEVRADSTWAYDDADRLLSSTVGAGADALTTFRRYDPAGRLRYVIVDADGDGVVSSSPTGGPTDPDDQVTEYTYTATDKVASKIEGPVGTTSYDWAGGDQSLKRTTTYGYDQAGRLITITDPMDGVTTVTWTDRNEQLRVTAPGGAWRETSYDPAGRPIAVAQPSPTGSGTAIETTAYDATGLVAATTALHQSTDTTPPTTTSEYWPDGLLASTTNPLGGAANTVSYFYDARGNRTARVSTTQDSTSATAQLVTDEWAYDLADRLVSSTPAGGDATTYGYDELTGWLTTTTTPSGRVTTTNYWHSGQPRTVTTTKPADATGPADAYRACSWFDTAGRRTVALVDDPAATTACADGDEVTTQTWARTGQLAEVTFPDNHNTPSGEHETYAFGYDQAGRPATVGYPDGSTHVFGHDLLGRLTSTGVAWSGGVLPIADYSYDDNGYRLTENVAFDEASRAWTYPANGAPYPDTYTQQITGGDRETALAWNPDGTLATETTDSETRAYSYDDAQQLLGRTDTAGADYAYTYGPRGLRLSATVDTTTTYTYNDRAQLLEATTGSDTTTLTWDDDGRRLTKSAPDVIDTTSYDARGLPTGDALELDTYDLDLTYRHDIDARRSALTVADDTTTYADPTFAWDPTRPTALPVQARITPTSWGRFNHGTEPVGLELGGTGTIYFSLDTQRSDLQTTADPNAPTTYDPFGAPDVIGPMQWAYRTQIQFGYLLHLRNRDYDPATGTFTTPDPLDGRPGTTGETNPYHYVNNNPVNHTDLLGLSPDECSSSLPGPLAWIANFGCEHQDGLTNTLKVVGSTAAGAACGLIAAPFGPTAAGAAGAVCSGATKRGLDAYQRGEDPWDAAFDPKRVAVDAAIGAATGKLADTLLPGTVPQAADDLGADTLADDIADDLAPDGLADDIADDLVPEGAANDALEAACTPHSFSATTPVLMANGTRIPIKDVKVGDSVLATDPSTGRTQARTVTATMSHDDDDLRDLTIVDSDGHHGTLRTTDHHKIWSVTAGAWVLASDLHEGDQLREDDGTTATLVESNKRPGHEQMLDLTIDTDHTFYVDAGGQAILVHNCSTRAWDIALKTEETHGLMGFESAEDMANYIDQVVDSQPGILRDDDGALLYRDGDNIIIIPDSAGTPGTLFRPDDPDLYWERELERTQYHGG